MIIESFMNFLSKIMCFTGFVNNATGFPKPLTQEEEMECIKRFKNGDMEAKNRLIQHNLRLVAHIVKKYSTAGEADDLISVGTIGLIKAINTFEPSKNTQLSTYSARCIENEILMLLRMTKKHNSVYSLEDSLGTDKDGNEIALKDIIASDDDITTSVENSLLSRDMDKLIKKVLPEREYQIITLRFGLGGTPAYTQREVSKMLGISRSYISRLENKAIDTIKLALKGKNIFQ